MPVSILIPNKTGFQNIFGLTPDTNGSKPSTTAVNSANSQLNLATNYINASNEMDPVVSTDKTKITWIKGDTSGYYASFTMSGTNLNFDIVENDTFSINKLSYKVMNSNVSLASLDLGLAISVNSGRLNSFGFTSLSYKAGDISITNKGGIVLNTATEVLTFGAGISINTLSGSTGSTAINNLNFDGNINVNLITGELSGKINSLTISNGSLVKQVFKASGEANSELSIKGLNLDIETVIDLGRDATSDEFAAKLFAGTTDTVSAYVSMDMVAGLEIAKCLGTDEIYVTGNKLNNIINGNSAANVINGGAGRDTMVGGDGNDTYYVDNYKDVVTEMNISVSDVDTVFSYIGYTLPKYVENLYLQSDSKAIQGFGNASSNVIVGNDYSNVIWGVRGSDRLDGAGNSDVYIIKNTDELGSEYKISDTGSNGNDIVRWNGLGATLYVDGLNFSGIEQFDIGLGSSIIPTNPISTAPANINASSYSENGLKIQGNYGKNTLTGTILDDKLYGLKGNDSLIGGNGNDYLSGGVGNDTLAGGSGRDTFVFDFAPNNKTNLDTIIDFTPEIDVVQLSKSIFKGFSTTGTLAESAFYASAGATSGHDSTDRIIYNTTTGGLYYDADGEGGKAAVQIAIVGISLDTTIAFTDFGIIG